MALACAVIPSGQSECIHFFRNWTAAQAEARYSAG